LIDFHCHLDLFSEPQSAAEAAHEAGLYVLSVTTTPKAFVKTALLAKGKKRIQTALGLHPEIAHLRKSELPLFDRLVVETRYVGEVGLDGSRDFAAHFEDQEMVFDHVLSSCAKAGGKIISIHSRNAATKVLDALERHPGFGIPIMHWFSGTPSQLRRAIDMGCWFSVGRPMLKSSKGRQLVSTIPRNRILTETDAPFTTKDEKSYQPAEVKTAVEELASLWEISPTETGNRLKDNLRTLLAA